MYFLHSTTFAISMTNNKFMHKNENGDIDNRLCMHKAGWQQAVLKLGIVEVGEH